MRLLLLDKSALAAGPPEAEPGDEVCMCAVTRLEILYSARSGAEYDAVQDRFARFRDLRMDSETFRIALTAHRDLARLGTHRVSMPDLLIAACAQQHGAVVLHRDRHYQMLARVLSFSPVRV